MQHSLNSENTKRHEDSLYLNHHKISKGESSCPQVIITQIRLDHLLILEFKERQLIEKWLSEDVNKTEIGRRLGRDRSTIHREINRGKVEQN